MQLVFNKEHGITPVTIKKPVREKEIDIKDIKHLPKSEIPNLITNLIIELETEMNAAAAAPDFERAIQLTDRVKALRSDEGGSEAPGKNRQPAKKDE